MKKNITIDEYIKKKGYNIINNALSQICFILCVLSVGILILSFILYAFSSNVFDLPSCPNFDSCYTQEEENIHNIMPLVIGISLSFSLGLIFIARKYKEEITIPITDEMRQENLNEWEEHIEELKRKSDSKVRLDKAKLGQL